MDIQITSDESKPKIGTIFGISVPLVVILVIILLVMFSQPVCIWLFGTTGIRSNKYCLFGN